MTGVPASTNMPMLITRTPWPLSGIILPPIAIGCPRIPSIIGMLGPYRSPSIRPTAAPICASATATFAATVDLPTPPLPDATASAFLTPMGIAAVRRSSGGTVNSSLRLTCLAPSAFNSRSTARRRDAEGAVSAMLSQTLSSSTRKSLIALALTRSLPAVG